MKRLALVLLVALLSSTATAVPPEYSGVVVRGTAPVAFVWWEGKSGLVAAIGGDPADYCSGGDDVDWVAFQGMNIRDGLRFATIIPSSNVRASLYYLSDFDPYDEFCEGILAGEVPFGTLEVNFRYQDNDYFGLQQCASKENFNSFGYSFEGPLYSDENRKRQFSGHVRGVLDCDSSRFVLYDVKLLLTK